MPRANDECWVCGDRYGSVRRFREVHKLPWLCPEGKLHRWVKDYKQHSGKV